MRKYNAPKVKESRGIQILTTIWLVPLVALIIALWLAFQYYAKIGSQVTIRFESNAGLVENQSPIKMRDVTVGIVKKISLADDGKGVIVKARLNKEMNEYLNNNARFWIVHADVGSHGVSGLDTIVSGSYIALHSKKAEESVSHFIGLEAPYIDQEAKGHYYMLSAPFTNDVTEGSNVYYRMFKVGRVERVSISPDGKQVNFTIFIEDQYTHFINKRSLFYTRSNFAFDFSQGKLDFSIANLSQIVHGGISIYTPTQTLNEHHPINVDHVFPLYKSLAEMKAKHLGTGEGSRIYAMTFEEDVTRLEIGSPIEFKGFQVGYVTDVASQYNPDKRDIESRAYALIYTSAFEHQQTENLTGEQVLEALVSHGLRAQLKSSVPVVGSLFIDLVFDTNGSHPSRTIAQAKPYNVFPTLQQTPSSNLMGELNNVLVKIQKLPIEALLNSITGMVNENRQPIKHLLVDLDQTIKRFDTTLKNVNTLTSSQELSDLPNRINGTLQELQSTLQEIQSLTQSYGKNSQFSDQLSSTLKTLSEALNSIKQTNKMLNRNPNALILGDQ
ncbi:MAG TPA: MCE family protein [Campylobacterales bacterium]|nr:MCE family protein [Campylobacterales bacterium]